MSFILKRNLEVRMVVDHISFFVRLVHTYAREEF